MHLIHSLHSRVNELQLRLRMHSSITDRLFGSCSLQSWVHLDDFNFNNNNNNNSNNNSNNNNNNNNSSNNNNKQTNNNNKVRQTTTEHRGKSHI